MDEMDDGWVLGGYWSPWLWWTYPECQLYAFWVEMKTTGHLVVRVGSLLKLSSVTLERGRRGRRERERERERGGKFSRHKACIISVSLCTHYHCHAT